MCGLTPKIFGSLLIAQVLFSWGTIIFPAESPSSNSSDLSPPCAKMSLADYLEKELGPKKFHRRVEWAGHLEKYQPIIKPPRVWEPIGRVQYLTIHHASGIPPEHSAKMIRNIFMGHTAMKGRLGGSVDVGYHLFVDGDGEVWEGRNASHMGSHVGSKPPGLNNEGNLGICGLGTYARENPPKAMSEAVVNLCTLICRYYGRPLEVRGHRDWFGIHGFKPVGNTDCPGRLERAVQSARTAIASGFKSVASAPKQPEGAGLAQ